MNFFVSCIPIGMKETGRVRELESEGLDRREIDKRMNPKKNLWTVISGGEWSSLRVIETI